MFLVPLLLIIAVFQLLISLGMALEGRRSNSSVQKVFAALCSTIFIWTLINVFLLYVDTYATVSNLHFFNFANILGFMFGGMSVFFIYLFSLYFPEKKQFKRLQKIVFGISALTIAASPTVFVSGEFVFEGNAEYIPGPGSSILAVLALLVCASVYIENAKSLRGGADKKLKSQVSTLMAGLTLTIVHAIVFIIVLPLAFGDNTTFYAIGYCAPFFYTGLTIYGLFRQGLFDVRLVIARSAAYLLSILTFGLVYSLTVVTLSVVIFSGDEIKLSEQVFYALSALFIGLSFQGLKRFFDKKTNFVFYRDAYDPQVFLDQLNKELVSTVDLELLLRRCAEIIDTNLKSQFSLFGLKETAYSPQRVIGTVPKDFHKEDIEKIRKLTPSQNMNVFIADEMDESSEIKHMMQKYDVAVLGRLAAESEANLEGLGYLILGAKKSGNPYNKQDIRMMTIILNELVIAIQNALRYEEIEKFASTLQDKVESATKELQRTNEKLKQMDETKDEFISMASHQLRTPLTSVKGYLSMVLEGDVGEVNDKQNKMLEQAYLSSQRMVYLIADLLNVSRLKTGKFVIDPKETDLAKVIETEVEQLQPTAKSRDLKLSFKKPKNFPSVMIDETKIRQVIMNFIDNAIYYTPAGGKIEVGLVDKGETIEYTVKDTGMGVPKSERHNLFSKFFRAGNARKARPDGTGLGLFMAKKVVVTQGGAIIFETEEGKGSTFGFTFAKKKLEQIAEELKKEA